MTTETASAASVRPNPPWVYRRFLKDTKLRVQERYWRHAEHQRSRNAPLTVIPNGNVWRRYLRMILWLIDRESRVKWILLESAAELMDWRNTSPSIQLETGEWVSESAALQERNKIMNCVQEHPENTLALCDLSVRETDHDEWHVLHYPDMNVAERSRNALFRAGRFLGDDVTLLVDDKSQNEWRGSDLLVVDMDEFLSLIGATFPEIDMNELCTLKQVCDETYSRRNAPKIEDALHVELSEEQVRDGLRSGTLLRGRLEVTKANPKEAYVSAGGKDRYYINLDTGNSARALHHDVVVVRPLPESEWGRPLGRRRLVYHHTDEEEGTDVEEEGATVPSACIVSVVSVSRRQFVATLVDSPSGGERTVLVVPFDIRIPKIRIQSRAWPSYMNQRLLVEIDGWETGSNYPGGHCVRIIGPIGDMETEITCLLFEHEIQLNPFSAKALACLPPKGSEWSIPTSEEDGRRDLRRSHRIFSVDPPGCQDIDDAMHARVLPNGDVEVGVHIADVTYFVPHDSALDKEAQVRGTTFYLVDRRFDMLPSLLSSDLCSLHGNTDRLAMSVIWTFSSDLETVISCWYGRTIIHNCQAMTYEQAHNILHEVAPDDPSKPPPPPLTAGVPVDPSLIAPLKQDLGILQTLTRKLRKNREIVGGAVDLSSGDLGTELKFALDEDGNPTKVEPKKELEIHHTIAEMMILANQYVAAKIYRCFPGSSLLRVHRSVATDRFEELESALTAAGIDFDGSSNMALAASLDKAKREGGKGNKLVNSLWQSLATRAMSEALYICTGLQEQGVGLSHYGLGIDKYTHFTSPIRRYADVVVHKQLLAALAVESLDVSPTQRSIANPRLALEDLPDSSAISILKGEGLSVKGPATEPTASTGVEDNEFLDSLIEGASELALTGNDEHDTIPTIGRELVPSSIEALVPYSAADVGKICEGLNKQNRMAKLSSVECQRLFLSLYFNDHVEVAQGVVTDLRANGLIVYVPKFDLKGPLYLCDTNGDVQIDPSFVGLARSAGLPPTLSFVNAPNCRRFPSGRCFLSESNKGGSLEVVIPEAPKPCVFYPLGLITVQISCDLSDLRARVPPPRFHLASAELKKTSGIPTSSEPRKVTTSMIRGEDKESSEKRKPISNASSDSRDRSMYEQLSLTNIQPVLTGVPLRRQQHKVRVAPAGTNATGRIVFGGFHNPDTHSATQEAAIAAASEAASQRRAAAIAGQSRCDEYDATRAIERDVTSRMQRLAAEKRSARKSKGK